MDLVEDSAEVDGDSVSGEALLPGLLWAEEEEDCPDVATSSAGLQECLSRRLIPLMVALRLCRMVMPEHLWGQCQERTPMLRK
jgi:hypothetical protein